MTLSALGGAGPLGAALAKETLQVTGDRLARRQGAGLVVHFDAGGLLQPLYERLHVWIALHRDVDLAVVVRSGVFKFRGVDRHADKPFQLADQSERSLGIGG